MDTALLLLCYFCVGNCVLGDFGATGEIGEVGRQYTQTHWPYEPTSQTPSTPASDFFCLAVTLLERAGVHDLRGSTPPTKDGLLAALEKLESQELHDFKGTSWHPYRTNQYSVWFCC